MKLRILLCLFSLSIISYLCWGEYLEYRQLNRTDFAYVPTVQGFVNGASAGVASTPATRFTVLVPVHEGALSRGTDLWRDVSSASGGKLYPVLVCMDGPCGELPSNLPPISELGIVDHLPYTSALAVSEEAARHQVILLDRRQRVRLIRYEPTTTQDVQRLVSLAESLND